MELQYLDGYREQRDAGNGDDAFPKPCVAAEPAECDARGYEQDDVFDVLQQELCIVRRECPLPGEKRNEVADACGYFRPEQHGRGEDEGEEGSERGQRDAVADLAPGHHEDEQREQQAERDERLVLERL